MLDKKELKVYIKSKYPYIFAVLKFGNRIWTPCWYQLLKMKAEIFKLYVFLYMLVNKKLVAEYTLGNRIPMKFRLFDNRQSKKVHITEEVYTDVLQRIGNGSFAYYGATYDFLQNALKEHPVRGKSVLVCGLESCNCDMISIYHGADKVYVTDYQPVLHDHPQVQSYHVDDFAKSGIKVDMIISISSFEHDGLGRYGDPLVPEGDLKAMENVRRQLKDDGLLFLAVPVGPDCICINAGRIYGHVRLPLLLKGWEVVDSYGFEKSLCDGEPSIYSRRQPVFVLRKCASEAV
ncbi:MAG: DUF268 domain-containing protein [Desulfobulbus sp.]|jgi:hypothetical protein